MNCVYKKENRSVFFDQKSAVSHDGLPFEVKRAVPNAETRAALAEYTEMRKNPAAYKRYDSFDDVLNEVLSDA